MTRSANQSNSGEFSIIVIPDTQVLSQKLPEHFYNLTKWIASNAAELNVKAILHLGDVVNNGEADLPQYERAAEAWKAIDETGIPYVMVPGNHDYDNMLKTDRNLSLFNQYFATSGFFGNPAFGGVFEEGRMENSYILVEAEGQKYIFIGLEFGARDEVLAWCDEVLAANRDRQAFIITHCYMFCDGERNRPGSDHNPKIYPGADGANDGEDMWNKSFKHHPNVLGVFSGHQIHGVVSYRTDFGDNGNPVFQSFQNWQHAGNGGEGRVRVLRVRPAAGEIAFSVFNPNSGEYEHKGGYDGVMAYGDKHEPLYHYGYVEWVKKPAQPAPAADAAAAAKSDK
jgi:hypothetical protein